MRLKHTCSDCLFMFTWLIQQLTCPYIAIGACFLFRLAIASQLWASLWERNQSLIYIYIFDSYIYTHTYTWMKILKSFAFWFVISVDWQLFLCSQKNWSFQTLKLPTLWCFLLKSFRDVGRECVHVCIPLEQQHWFWLMICFLLYSVAQWGRLFGGRRQRATAVHFCHSPARHIRPGPESDSGEPDPSPRGRGSVGREDSGGGSGHGTTSIRFHRLGSKCCSTTWY